MNPDSASLQVAQQFYQLLLAKNPLARARWREIMDLGRRGDPEAVRAMQLMLSVMQGPSPVMTGATPAELTAYLRQVLVWALFPGTHVFPVRPV